MRRTLWCGHGADDALGEGIGGIHWQALARWRRAYLDNLTDVRALGFDERFIRMWEYYLAYCEAGFRTTMLGSLQIVMGRSLWRAGAEARDRRRRFQFWSLAITVLRAGGGTL